MMVESSSPGSPNFRHLTKLALILFVAFFFIGFFGHQRNRSYSKIRGDFLSQNLGHSFLQLESQNSDLNDVSSPVHPTKPENFEEKADSNSDMPELKITIFNEYVHVTDFSYYPWQYIAEPYRPTTLRIENHNSDSYIYEWRIDGLRQDYGHEIQAVFLSVGTSEVQIFEMTESRELNRQFTFDVSVKYVRREIRELTDVDREMFFSAVMIMQRVPTEIGQHLYGEDYKDKDYFNRLHLYYGGSRICDHWHEGAGFVTSHMALTLEFEQALQSINPMLTVPYWDFTLESTFYEAEDFRTSGVFSDDWFGSVDPDNGLRTPTQGRFAYVPIMTSAEEFSKAHNSYGLLRAPWNNDPTPFLTRSAKVYGVENNQKPSGCKEYKTATLRNSWLTLAKALTSAAHGHIHEILGGAWHHSFGKDINFGGTDDQHYFTHEIQALSKKLWRYGYLNCPFHCDADTPSDECMCTCDANIINEKPAYEILYETGVLAAAHYFDEDGEMIESLLDENGNIYYTLPGKTDAESSEIFQTLLKQLCTPGHIGDMFQGSSTNDITFWVLHPTIDRLWHFARLTQTDDFDDSWPDNPAGKSQCYGHRSTDIQPFKNLFQEDGQYLSNEVIKRDLDPSGDAIPYIYGHFKWEHCSLDGYNIVEHKVAQRPINNIGTRSGA